MSPQEVTESATRQSLSGVTVDRSPGLRKQRDAMKQTSLIVMLALLLGMVAVVPAGAAGGTAPRLGADTWVDVDGDRSADHVTLTDLGDRTRVTVRTALGRISSRNVAYDDNQGGLPVTQRLVGAATVDGRPGVELVVFVVLGDCGHDEVLTWRDDKLVKLPPPRGLGWGVCFLGSAPFGEGYARRVRQNRVQLLHYAGVQAGMKVDVRRTVYTWRPTGWVKQSTAKMRVTAGRSYRLWAFNFPWVTPSSPPMVGDLNDDQVVDCADKSILVTDWGTATQRSDLNSDLIVNIEDLSILVAHWTGPQACA